MITLGQLWSSNRHEENHVSKKWKLKFMFIKLCEYTEYIEHKET